MDLAPLEKVGKREAEDAIETEVVSAKKQKVEESVSEIKIDTTEVAKIVGTSSQSDNCCFQPDQCIEVKVSGVDGHVVSVLEDKSNLLEEDAGAVEKKPAVASKEGLIAAAFEIDEPNDDADSCLQDETSLDEDVAAAIKDPASLSKEDSAAPPNKKDESTKKSPSGPTEEDPVVSWIKKDESCSDNDGPTKFTAESTSSGFTKKEDEINEELELDDETSSSDDDTQAPATPTEQTSGGKTLYVGNLSFSVEQEDVEQFFKAAGEVVNIRFAMNSDETFKGYGYVEFASAEAAEKALCDLNGKELLRRRVRLDFVKQRGSFTPYNGQDTVSFQKGGKAQWQTVFVSGFKKSDCQDEIRKSLEEHFGSCGEISRVSAPKDQDGCLRGIAYIDFKNRDAFIRALALNGSAFREGILSVKEARPRGDSCDSADSGRCYGRNDGRHGWHDFGGRSGWSNFRGRSGWRDFRGRSGIRETGAWSGAGGWRDFRGRSGIRDNGAWSGAGVWRESNGRGVWRDSNGRGIWRDSNGRGVWAESNGRGVWGDSNRRGVWGNSNGRGISNGRGVWRDSSGRGGSNGRGVWGDSNGRGVWRDSNGRGVWPDFSGRGILGGFSGRNNIRGSGGRGQGTLIKPTIAAPEAGNNTTLNNEGLEDEMN